MKVYFFFSLCLQWGIGGGAGEKRRQLVDELIV